MFTAAELITALHRRKRRSIRPPSPAGQFPPGWQAWLDAMVASPGHVRGAAADDIVTLLAAREPAPLPPGEVLSNRWRAFTALWRQQWEPARDDERGLRRLASSLSGVLHLVWLFLLAWLMVVPPWAGPTQVGDDSAIEVTWIGEGTPAETGAGPPAAAADAVVESSSAPPAPSPASTPSPQPAPTAVAENPPQPVPEPEPAPAAAEQPLVVTETPAPDTAFVVPPPPELRPLQPRLRERTVELREREIPQPEPVELARPELPTVRPLQPAPRVEQPVVELAEREIVAPPRALPVPDIAAPTVEAPVVRRDAPPARVREIAVRERAREEGASPAAEAAAAPSAPGSTARSPASADAGSRPDATAAGAGPSNAPAPGALPSTRRGDDWDAAASNRPGGQSGTAGLFNRDGRPQLPPGAGGRVGGGLPPGTVTEDYEKIDRMGTWLRRPPTDYEPTTLDRFWVPHENLLEEWVRRSIRTVLIPIPGTSKSIRCDVALLAFGGGCGITDPNLQDVEAGARPPPDIPYKPDLQEGAGDW